MKVRIEKLDRPCLFCSRTCRMTRISSTKLPCPICKNADAVITEKSCKGVGMVPLFQTFCLIHHCIKFSAGTEKESIEIWNRNYPRRKKMIGKMRKMYPDIPRLKKLLNWH